MVENQLKVIVIRIGNHVSNVPQHRAYLIFAYLNKTTMSDVNEMTQAELEFHDLNDGEGR